jgi:F0F1-type ATP synthase membrane subunit b/b'
MTESKRNRIVAAVTVNIVVLVVVLVAVIIYQLVCISVLTERRRQIENEIKNYQLLTEQAEKDLEYYQSEEYLYLKALKLGFTYDDQK